MQQLFFILDLHFLILYIPQLEKQNATPPVIY